MQFDDSFLRLKNVVARFLLILLQSVKMADRKLINVLSFNMTTDDNS